MVRPSLLLAAAAFPFLCAMFAPAYTQDASDEPFLESRISVSPTLLFEPNEQLSVFGRASYTRDIHVLDRGIDNFTTDNISGNPQATYKPNPDWSITRTLSANGNQRDGITIEPEAFLEDPASFNSSLAGLPAETMIRQAEFRETTTTDYIARFDLNGSFATSVITHDVVFSLDEFDTKVDSFFSQTGLNVLNRQGQAITLNEIAQDVGFSTTDGAAVDTDAPSTLTEASNYGGSFFDKLSFGEDLHLLVGGRLDYFDQ